MNTAARHWLETAIKVSWRLGNQSLLQMIFNNFGQILLEQGELEEAKVHLEVALSLAERGTERAHIKFPLGLLAGLHLRLGDSTQAQMLSEQCLSINQTCHDPEGTADALCMLAKVMLAQGRIDRAYEYATQAFRMHQGLNHEYGMGKDLLVLGNISRTQGHFSEAVQQYQQCFGLWHNREYTILSTLVLDGLADALLQSGVVARSVTLSSAARALRERVGAKLTAAEQAQCDVTITACQALLEQDVFADAWAAGRILLLAQAVALALLPIPAAESVPTYSAG